MKWDKALTYLVVVFLCVNIGLAIGNYNKNVKAYRVNDKRKENIIAVLKDNNIMVKTKLPIWFQPTQSIWLLPSEMSSRIRDDLVRNFLGTDESIQITQEMGELPYEQPTRVYAKDEKKLRFSTNYVHYENTSVTEGTQFIPENQAVEVAERFLKEVNMHKSIKKSKMQYKHESYGASVTYYEVYDGFPIFGSYIHMRINEGGVFQVTLHGNTVEEKVANKQAIYPIDTVLFGLIDEVDTSQSVIIEDITLGYAVPNLIEMHILKEEAVPMYKISIQGLDRPIFVNAYTNTVEDLPTGTFYK